MAMWREESLVGLAALEAVTVAQQRVRQAHRTAGSFEAAEIQWWWSQPRPSDDRPQPIWYDDQGPVAAVMATAWADSDSLTFVLPADATRDQWVTVVDRGLAVQHAHGVGSVSIEVGRDDQELQELLAGRRFVVDEPGLAETWLVAADRPAVSPLADGYRLATRADSSHLPHHMIHGGRNHQDCEPRLRQTSLYRPDLDLVVYTDADGERDSVAAYGLFWYDPTTSTGVVEPMRTEDAHQRRGLARHVLTSGIERLAAAGAERIKICYELDNPASRNLYLDVGFVPARETDVWVGPTA